MTPTLLRQVVDTNDAYLRRFTHEYPKVFAKFTADDCPLCAELAPCFARFADDPANKDILFVRLSADENPVAQQLLQKRAAPFFVSYCQGRLLECDVLATEAEVLAQLARLRDFLPTPR